VLGAFDPLHPADCHDSIVDSDRARNLQLLKERSWFDVQLVYANQRRAIIAIEKGG